MSNSSVPDHWLNILASSRPVAAGDELSIEVVGGAIVRRAPVAGHLFIDRLGRHMFAPDFISDETARTVNSTSSDPDATP